MMDGVEPIPGPAAGAVKGRTHKVRQNDGWEVRLYHITLLTQMFAYIYVWEQVPLVGRSLIPTKGD